MPNAGPPPYNTSLFEIDFSVSSPGAVSQYDCDSIIYFRNTGHLQKIALDSIVFTGSDSLAVERLTKLQLYKGIKADSILQLDSTLVAFADTFELSDLGKLHDISVQFSVNMAKSSADKLKANLNNIATTDTIADLWKETLILRSTWSDNDSITELSASDSSRLWLISALCPYIDGPAVYEARTMLFSLDSVFLSLGNSCEIPTYNDPNGKRENPEEETVTVSEELFVEVYPNPTTGILNVNLVGEMEEPFLLHAMSLDGKEVISQVLHQKHSVVDVSNLSKGIYFVRLSSSLSQRNVYRGKVVLVE